MNNNENNINTNVENTSNNVNTNPQEKFVMQQPQIVQSNTVQMPQVNPQPVNPQSVAQPEITNTENVVNNDPNAMINENLKKVEIKDYTPPSKFKMVLLVLFFILLIAFVIFLPEISTLIKNYQSPDTSYQKEEITTGRLICTLETNTADLNKDYEFIFTFTNSKLLKEKFVTTTRGDSTSDEKELDKLSTNCKVLEKETADITGAEVRCDYSEGKMVETQSFNLEEVDSEKLDAAFTEAGGIMPGYQYNQDINSIEKNMKAAGYTCNREK